MHKISFIYPRIEPTIIARTRNPFLSSSFHKNVHPISYIERSHASAAFTLNTLGKKNQSHITSSGPLISRCGALHHLIPFRTVSIADAVQANISKSKSKSKSKSRSSVNLDNFGTWDNHLELPILMESSIKHGEPIPNITASNVGCYSILGKRTYQEDRFVVLDLPNNILCCAVFDGHGGEDCSDFCAKNIESELLMQLEQHKDLETVLHSTFLSLHNKFTQKVNESRKKEKSEKVCSGAESPSNLKTSGTTATVCLLRNGVELMVANVGDSQAVLCRLGTAKVVTKDHCPSNSGEKARIIQSGGSVSVDNIGRSMVNGALNMSRSIGDLHLKQFGVTELPDTRSIRVKHGKDAFLLLMTDGVDYVLSHEEIMNIVNNAQDPHQATRQLTEVNLARMYFAIASLDICRKYLENNS
ncbi:unnamed protein product, partial [Meganyctiphanes norvegica]